MYLMMQRAFTLGYRRYEWKCHSLNAASRAAAQRLGFSYEGVFRQARVTEFERVRSVPAEDLAELGCAHPLKGLAGDYDFVVPLLEGDHVSDNAGTGFVHTAPGHGREDFDVWTANARELEARGVNSAIPYTVDENGAYTDHAPGFTGKRVLTDQG